MAAPSDPRLVAAERLSDGIVIRFADGRTAFFSAALLYSLLSLARELDEAQPGSG